MADTPNNNIEKQLQDYAKQRRDAAGTPEMHPATRQMLQAEVKQRLGATQTTSRAAGWVWLWPKLAFACGVLAVLGIVVMFTLPPGRKTKENFTLAKFEEAKEARPVGAPRDAAPATAPMIAPADAAPAPARAVVAKAGQPAVLPGEVSSPATAFVGTNSLIGRNEPAVVVKPGPERVVATKGSTSLAAVPPADRTKAFSGIATAEPDTDTFNRAPNAKQSVAVAGTVNTKARATAGRDDGKPGFVSAKGGLADKEAASAVQVQNLTNQLLANAGQRYRNMAVLEDQKQADQLPVLDDFTVAQNGEMLTIVDRDGSVYIGYARPAPQARQVFDNNNYAGSANPVQLVPNSGGAGRAAATLDQRAMNRNYEQPQNARALTLDNAGQLQPPSPSLQNMSLVEPMNYLFRVEGTNRSLNERVVFTGNIVQNSGGNYSDNTLQNIGNAASNQSFRQQQNVPQFNQGRFNNRQQAPVLNNYINGRVQLGGKRETELNALSVGQ